MTFIHTQYVGKIKNGRPLPFAGMPVYSNSRGQWYITAISKSGEDADLITDPASTHTYTAQSLLCLDTYSYLPDSCFILPGEDNHPPMPAALGIEIFNQLMQPPQYALRKCNRWRIFPGAMMTTCTSGSIIIPGDIHPLALFPHIPTDQLDIGCNLPPYDPSEQIRSIPLATHSNQQPTICACYEHYKPVFISYSVGWVDVCTVCKKEIR